MGEPIVSQRSTNRRTRQRPGAAGPMDGKPFRLVRNPFRPLEALSGEQLARIHEASMRIVEEIGIDFLDAEALQLWHDAGARVDWKCQHVWIDREHLLSLVGKAPSEFTLRALNPERSLVFGGNAVNFATVGGAPFYSDLETGRRPGSLAAFEKMVKLAQVCNPIHIVEGLLLEPQDIPVPIRHLEKNLIQLTTSDKVYTAAAHGRDVASDYIHMAAIVFGGLDSVQRQPVMAAVVNANSPLRFDGRMLGGLIMFARYGQPAIVTPFILAGAMSPVTLAAAIAQQNSEALAGIALTQLVNPGCPVIYGGFTTNIDMQTGSPAFGTPEGALALMTGAQLARYYGVPYRGSGGLNNAKLPDAQASYETQMSLWPAVMAHANIILHSAGWLEAGLVCSLEKFVIDVEGLAVFQRMLGGVEVSDETLALESIAEVGPGGHHLGTAHTLERYRSEFYLPFVSDRQNYDKWLQDGQTDAARRAHGIANVLLGEYERPPLDPGVREELRAYVERRKSELAGTG